MTDYEKRLLAIRLASLKTQADGLTQQRRAILGEAEEIQKLLAELDNIPVKIGESDSVS